MRILLLNTYEDWGGAAKAAHQLHNGLLNAGINSEYLVGNRRSCNETILSLYPFFSKELLTIRKKLDQCPLMLYPNRTKTLFSRTRIHSSVPKMINRLNPDIVHLHWIADGFMAIEDIAKINKPIIWTLHDMWPFTGGCHYDDECGKYTSICKKCPALCSGKENDLSTSIFNRKMKTINPINLTIVTPSKWLASCAEKSQILRNHRITVVPNGINTNKFQPKDKVMSKKSLGFLPEKKLILFGAMFATSHKRKGFQELHSALNLMHRDNLENIDIVVFGLRNKESYVDPETGYRYLKEIQDNEFLSQLYSAADAVIVPSLQENLSNIVMESLACGTPVVAFNIGGMPDMIEHQNNGYLAKPFDIDDLAHGIEWILENDERHKKLCANARKKVEDEFDIQIIAKRYEELYTEILQANLQGQS